MLAVRADPHEVGLRRIEYLALDQLIEQRRNLRPSPRRLQRAQFQPQRRRVHARFLAQLLQQPQRFQRLAVLERNLRGEHKPRHGKALRLRVGGREEPLRRVEVADIDRARAAMSAFTGDEPGIANASSAC